MRLPLVALALAVVVLLVWLSRTTDTAMDLTNDTVANVAYLGIILAVALASMLTSYRNRIPTAVGHLLVWVALFGVLVVGYAYRFELRSVGNRTLGAIVPGLALSDGDPAAVAVTRSADGHFLVRATIEGRTMRMVVDTGASSVVLTDADARALGLSLTDRDYSLTTSTANGLTKAAPIVLSSVEIGDITISRVEALVARPGALTTSLLGNTFLTRLSSFSVEGDRLTFRR